MTEGGKALMCLYRKSFVFGGFGVKGLVGKRLSDRAPLVEIVLGGITEVAVDQAFPDVFHGLGRGMEHVGGIETIVAELIHQELVGGEVGNRARRRCGGSGGGYGSNVVAA